MIQSGTNYTVVLPSTTVLPVFRYQGIIKIEDENSNIITIDSNGIKMESAGNIELKASGDVKIAGTNVSIKASAQFKAEGSAGVEMSSGATAILKGSIVQIN